MSAPSRPNDALAPTSANSNEESTGSRPPATALGVGLLSLPPDLLTPSPPQGYEPTTGTNYRGILPWTSELVVLPKALQDLARFASTYASTLGRSVPAVELFIEALTIGGRWSTERAASAAWDGYCRDQEGSAWRLINSMMESVRAAFALAAKADAAIASEYPSLTELLETKKVHALKGASTRKKNKKAQAEGKPATHGVTGKARQKRAERAALAAAKTEASAPPIAKPTGE